MFYNGANLVISELWSMMAGTPKKDATAIVKDSGNPGTGNILEVDAFKSGEADKDYRFETSIEVPANFKVEIRLRLSLPDNSKGPYPQLFISPTGSFNGINVFFRPTYIQFRNGGTYEHQKTYAVINGNWETITITHFAGVFTLHHNGVSIGAINDPNLTGGTIQVRVQDMIAEFDYFDVREFDGSDPFLP